MSKLVSKKKLRKFLRYVIMFLVLFISTQYIPECTVSYETAGIMAMVASVTFCVIDMYFPVLCHEN